MSPMTPDPVLLAASLAFGVAFVVALITWRRARDGYVDAWLAGSIDARVNFKLHLLLVIVCPVGAVLMLFASFAKDTT